MRSWTNIKRALALGALGASTHLADLLSIAVQGLPLFRDYPVMRHVMTAAVLIVFLSAVVYAVLPDRDGDGWADIVDPDPDVRNRSPGQRVRDWFHRSPTYPEEDDGDVSSQREGKPL